MASGFALMGIKVRHKFGAIRCESHGIKFPSKLERDCYDVLRRMQANGEILFFLRQIGFDLPSCRHFVDFMVAYPDEIKFIEAKGRDLGTGKIKRNITEQIYNIKIEVITKPSQIMEL